MPFPRRCEAWHYRREDSGGRPIHQTPSQQHRLSKTQSTCDLNPEFVNLNEISRKTNSLPHHYKLKPMSVMRRSAFNRNHHLSNRPASSERVPAVPPHEFKRRCEIMTSWFKDFSQDQKTLALQKLFPYMDGNQFHWLGQQFPNEDLHILCQYGCNDPLLQIPPHLAYKILSYLDPVSLARAGEVCHYWQYLTSSDWLWQRLCFASPWKLGSKESGEQLDRRQSIDNAINWKTVFRERYKLHRSWLRGQCHVRTFEGHTGGISCVQFDNNRIVSGSHDKTIRVWNIKTNSKWSVITLTGHSGEVRCLHLEGNRLVSGSTDSTIKVWNLDIQPEWSSIACRVTMVGHTDTVRCVKMNTEKQLVISGSYDSALKIWSLQTGECLKTLRGHEGHVLCMYWADDLLLSGSADKTIKLWSVESGSCRLSLTGHRDAVTCLSLESKRIISGSLDRSLKIWTVETGQCLATLDWMSAEGHTGVIRCLQADSWRIVSAADDKMIKVWSLETGQRLVTLRSHTDGVTCLQFNDFVIVSGSYDKTVKLWDFTVC